MANARAATSTQPVISSQPGALIEAEPEFWRRVDLHVHTPASADYMEAAVSPLDILLRAEEQGLDVIGVTDHNSVRGYADMWREIEDLELLDYLGRATESESQRLADYRRLLARILVLPGFEFTATFGFHILAIFPENTSVRMMEHLLLTLGVPEDRFGSGEVGATTDVLRAYQILDDHGALVIGAHVNSTGGIAMQGLRFGGQTKIAYTQDEHLHALEVTDLTTDPRRRSTARFFNGTKAEYARRMHCIQGSDAHRLARDPQRPVNLGIGDRATEIYLPVVSFDALKAVFTGDDFSLTRPYVPDDIRLDPMKTDRADGNTAKQAFHESVSTKRTGAANVLRDVVAFANADGGTVYVGASPFAKRPVAGVADAETARDELHAAIAAQITPALTVAIDVLTSDGKNVLALRVPRGTEQPYALVSGAIYVRHDAESAAATRDEIVAMVRRAIPATPAEPALNTAEPDLGPTETAPVTSSRRGRRGRGRSRQTSGAPTEASDAGALQATINLQPDPASATPTNGAGHLNRSLARPSASLEYATDAPPDPLAPLSGVEIVDAVERDGVTYYALRDLRSQRLVFNVTRDTPERLWRYAIQQHEERPVVSGHVRWRGDFGFLKSHKQRNGERRYNLAYRNDDTLRVFYGVDDDGIDDRWRAVLPVARH